MHLNGACRQVGDWSTRVSSGLWTRHSHDYSVSSVLDYSVISAEHLDSVRSMEVDQDGHLAGGSDHVFVLTGLKDKFVIVSRMARDQTERGWNIEEDQDWSAYKEVVRGTLEETGTTSQGGVEDLSYSITGAMLAGLQQAIGRRKPRRAEGERRYPREIVELVKEQKKLETKWKTEKVKFADSRSSQPRSSLVVAGQELRAMRERVQEEIRIFNRQRRAPLLKTCRMKTKKSLKTFWRYVSQKPKSSEEITSLQRRDTGVMIYRPEELADEALRYLKVIFNGQEEEPGAEEGVGGQVGDQDEPQDHQDGSPSVSVPLPTDHRYGMDPDPGIKSEGGNKSPGLDPKGYMDRDVTRAELGVMLDELRNGKASGWDDIPNEALKNAPESLLVQVVRLYNNVKESGKVPAAWRRGRLVLVHKKGPRTDAYNYRPLTVINSVAALYSKLLNKRLTEVVETHKLLGEVQNGFRKGRSGTDCGFILSTVLWKSSALRKKPHLAFLDLQKAYDSVDR